MRAGTKQPAAITEVMGLTTKAIKSLLSRAHLNLRAALADSMFMDGQPVPEATEE
jgi:RNA polymerase sigma-70 factor (ECF subfamily)